LLKGLQALEQLRPTLLRKMKMISNLCPTPHKKEENKALLKPGLILPCRVYVDQEEIIFK